MFPSGGAEDKGRNSRLALRKPLIVDEELAPLFPFKIDGDVVDPEFSGKPGKDAAHDQ